MHPIAEAYKTCKRDPVDGSLAEAIKVHAQACGVVAYVFNLHPDKVAEIVKEEYGLRLAQT